MEVRREEMGKGKSELRIAMEELSLPCPGDEDEQQQQRQKRSSTMDLLWVSKHLIHVLDNVGPTLLVLRQDIQQNVQRLQDVLARDPCKYASLTAIVTEEVEEGTSKKVNSCTRAIVWLARSINFSKHLLEGLLNTRDQSSLEEIVEKTYATTLKPWHGWIASAAYRVAQKLIPEREIFIALLMGNCQEIEDFAEDVKVLLTIVQPLLDEANAILVKHNLDKLKST
ncbi:glycolipid transfer protein 2-like [Oryza brachyantha]|uniref:Glycolipid transfer protein domain-containing protein n=1 Tax=Oryza brachyantha TaxID=4533 RepID=J3MPP4_ORYBR|nr:glycolipid transfer protein 2-like [Oryza brachyantha]